MRLENPHPRRCAAELRKSHPAYHVIRLQPNDVDVPGMALMVRHLYRCEVTSALFCRALPVSPQQCKAFVNTSPEALLQVQTCLYFGDVPRDK